RQTIFFFDTNANLSSPTISISISTSPLILQQPKTTWLHRKSFQIYSFSDSCFL
ncbi:unnamed protein product, partial [Arabidopsis halleri]